MDHGFRSQKVKLKTSPNFKDNSDVVRLDYGFVFADQLILEDIRLQNEIDVLTIKIGPPFHSSIELFHLKLPEVQEEPAIHLRGTGGCIPAFFIKKISSEGSGDDSNFTFVNKKLSTGEYLLPLCLAIHDGSPDFDFEYDCNLAYMKLKKEDLSVLLKALKTTGVSLQAGLERDDYDVNHKYCKRVSLLSISGEVLGILNGQDYSVGDLDF